MIPSVYSLCILGRLTLLLLLTKKKKVVSLLNINLAKSELVLASNVDNVDGLVGILSCGVSSLPLTNLSLSLGASYKAKPI